MLNLKNLAKNSIFLTKNKTCTRKVSSNLFDNINVKNFKDYKDGILSSANLNLDSNLEKSLEESLKYLSIAEKKINQSEMENVSISFTLNLGIAHLTISKTLSKKNDN